MSSQPTILVNNTGFPLAEGVVPDDGSVVVRNNVTEQRIHQWMSEGRDVEVAGAEDVVLPSSVGDSTAEESDDSDVDPNAQVVDSRPDEPQTSEPEPAPEPEADSEDKESA